ncbi:MAG: aminotransferase class V-fold PLP-dependent enzyme [Oscillochloris sp.]|nr:aminotransferase class V-fold PLP-dependent enzyme [Oscillochloris sp.]
MNAAVHLPLPDLAAEFLLRRDIAFLNHGSFGACPRPVFETYQHWQRVLETQPVAFLGRRIEGLLAEVRATLGQYLNAAADDLALVPNATYGVNIVAHALRLGAEDAIVTTDHEYGAVQRTLRYVCGRSGAQYVEAQVGLPLHDPTEVIERLWAAVTPRTRLIVISHITSPTALIFPVAEVCRRARAAGILTLVDGAHAPGQLDLDLAAIGADFYTGNCHKWLCAPKGAAFLYVRPECQQLIDPLVVSWGYESRRPGASPFVDYFAWTGTADPAAYLSIPAAIAFQQQHDWAQVRTACRALLAEARTRITALSDQEAVCPDDPGWWQQLAIAPLPRCDAEVLKQELYNRHQVEVPIIDWGGRQFVRISVQGYNTPDEIDRLEHGIRQLVQV